MLGMVVVVFFLCLYVGRSCTNENVLSVRAHAWHESVENLRGRLRVDRCSLAEGTGTLVYVEVFVAPSGE